MAVYHRLARVYIGTYIHFNVFVYCQGQNW